MEKVAFIFGYAARFASLTSGITCISAFIIFFLLSLFARKSSPIRKQKLYNYCSLYLLLVGLYQIFIFCIMRETSDPARALVFHRLTYFFGLPTIPIFLYVVLILTVGNYREFLLSNRIKPRWKNLTRRLWWPIWISTALVWTVNLADLLTGRDVLLAARRAPIQDSFIPLMGAISSRYPLLHTNMIWRLWQVTFTVTVALSVAYLIRAIWFERPEVATSDERTRIPGKKSLDIFLRGLKNKNPTFKWIKTFAFLSFIHILSTAVQGLIGYDWRYSFPIPVYSASLLSIAFGFILIGEIVEARENVILAYTSSYGSRMVSIVAHEMSTPLFIIRDFINRLQKELPGGSPKKLSEARKPGVVKYANDLARVQKALDRLAKTVDDLRAKASIFRTRLKLVPLNELLSEEAVISNYEVNGKKFRFNVSTDPRIEKIRIDPEQMHVILRNLIENAIDALPQKGGVIQISSKLTGNHVLIVIQDNGIGIPRKQLPRVKEPFFTTKLKGTGLGLSIVHGFLDEIKGKLTIDSQEGNGTRVEIAFPRFT